MAASGGDGPQSADGPASPDRPPAVGGSGPGSGTSPSSSSAAASPTSMKAMWGGMRNRRLESASARPGGGTAEGGQQKSFDRFFWESVETNSLSSRASSHGTSSRSSASSGSGQESWDSASWASSDKSGDKSGDKSSKKPPRAPQADASSREDRPSSDEPSSTRAPKRVESVPELAVAPPVIPAGPALKPTLSSAVWGALTGGLCCWALGGGTVLEGDDIAVEPRPL